MQFQGTNGQNEMPCRNLTSKKLTYPNDPNVAYSKTSLTAPEK